MKKPSSAIRVLIVGAGAVGQTFAYHLHRGGAQVSVLVKPQYREACQKGFYLYSLNQKNQGPFKWEADQVLTSPEEVARFTWDAVFLCIPTTGLVGIEKLIQSIGDATCVNLVPGTLAEQTLRHWVPRNRWVGGVISLVAYAAPLPGETFSRPGTAFWLPPFSTTPLQGPDERVQPLLQILNAGGMKARQLKQEIQSWIGFPDALLTVLIASLRHANWELKTLCQSQHLHRLSLALKEVAQIVAHRENQSPPLYWACLTPWTLKTLITLAPRWTPFPLEALLKAHFNKVNQQMKDLLQEHIENGVKFGLPVDNLRPPK